MITEQQLRAEIDGMASRQEIAAFCMQQLREARAEALRQAVKVVASDNGSDRVSIDCLVGKIMALEHPRLPRGASPMSDSDRTPL